MTPSDCARRRSGRRMPIRRGACWRWRRSMTEGPAAMPLGIGGVGLQTVRDWVLAFNAEGPPGLVDGKACRDAPTGTPAHRQGLLEVGQGGALPAVHRASR